MKHKEILEKAKSHAKNPKDIPKIETLHQNLSHMTVALKEVETRLLRVTGKMNRLGIENRDKFINGLAECVAVLCKNISLTEEYINSFYERNSMFSVISKTNHDSKRIVDLLVCGFEGDVISWGEISLESGSDLYAIEEKDWLVKIVDTESKEEYGLRIENLNIGLQTMADKFNWHYEDFVNHNEDAITGSVFIQCCLFGDVIYE